jgi:hypothetical protein
MTAATPSEPNVKQAVPFFAVSNMEESLHFYIDGLGFEMTNKWVVEGKLRWCRLQLGGAALMLQEFRKEGLNASVPESKVGVGVSICFSCSDSLQIYRQLATRGVKPERPFVGNAMWVTGMADPDELQAFFSQPHRCPGRNSVFGDVATQDRREFRRLRQET